MRCNDEFICVELAHRGKLHHFIGIVFGIVMTAPLNMLYMAKYYLLENEGMSMLERVYSIGLMCLTVPVWLTMFVNDGIVSFARCHKRDEIMELIQLATMKAGRKECDYVWQCWRQKSEMMFPYNYLLPMTVLYGRPTKTKIL